MTQVVIVGLGLIGGSLALALKRKGYTCLGVDKHPEVIERALAIKAIDGQLKAWNQLQRDDIVIVATPLSCIPEILAMLADTPAVITDVCGVKEPIIDMAKQTLGSNFPRFVPGHPMAGTEHHGIAAAKADLFENRLCILTPTEATNPEAVSAVISVWQDVGAQVTQMEVRCHDEAMAWVSHLPHFLAFALAAVVPEEYLALAGDSFYSATRVAKSDPEQWANLLLANGNALLQAGAILSSKMEIILEALRRQDKKQLIQVLEESAKLLKGTSCNSFSSRQAPN